MPSPVHYLVQQSSGLVVQANSPAVWLRYGVGITVATGVSQWDDQSGNGRHLKQATAGNQPTLQADKSILWDGVDDFMACDAFTLNQPETVYMLFKQVTWTINEKVFDGNAANTGALIQSSGVTPELAIDAPTIVATNTNLAVDTYGVAAAVFNGASSTLQINNTAATTGNAGANNMGGLYVGSRGDGTTAFGNIQVKEVIVFATAHSADTRTRIIRYLAQVGALSF